MEKKLEKYIAEASSAEDPLLEELYRETHIRFVNPNMVSGHMQGLLLEMISYMISPKLILEVGTFTGYSAICLAKGLSQGGKLLTVESNDELADFSRSYFERAGLLSSIQLINGRLQDVISSIDKSFDLVYIDGDKREYAEYYRLVIGKVRPGGFIIADNVLWGGKVLDRSTNDPQTKGIIEFNDLIMSEKNIEKIVLPFRDGLMLIKKK